MAGLAFTKMHGLGNDFVVVDARARPFAPAIAQVRALADRRTGVGCDQLIVIENPVSGLADAFMRIRNADGGEVAACGNATRCVAALLMREKRAKHAIIETGAGLLDAETAGDDPFAIVAGPAASTSAVMAGRVRACPGHPRGSNEVIVEVFPGCVGVEDKACARWFPDYALASSGLRLLVTGATRYCAPTSHPL